jgi:hypothetical protein
MSPLQSREAMRAEIAELESRVAHLHQELYAMQERYRHARYPEPFRVGAVFGVAKNGTQYPLPILRITSEYPDIVVVVKLP